jgi:hypothetical protein
LETPKQQQMKRKQEREALHQGEPATPTRIPGSCVPRAYTYMSIEQRYQALLNWIVAHA